jgi:hypothetical protein
VVEVAFVLAPRQNLFFLELVKALREELEAIGVRTSLHWGDFPTPRQGLVYAVVPPHEYFTLMHGRVGVPPDVQARTIFICAEQPNTPFFDWNVTYAPAAGAVFDLNRLSVRELRVRGIEAEHLQLGWTQGWDALSERERDVDVLFMGSASERRLEYLSQAASVLWDRECRFVISDNGRPNWATSGSYVADDEKWDLLGRSKLLINIHQGPTPYFEWLRLVQAMASGCVVVTESSLDHEPLEPGRHFLAGRPTHLGDLAEHLLDDGDARWKIQTAAYEFVKSRLRLGTSVRRLAEAAQRLDAQPAPDPEAPYFMQAPPDEADAARAIARLSPPSPWHEADPSRRVLKDLKLELMDVRRRFERLQRERLGPVPELRVERRSKGYLAARPRVTVLVSLYNYADHIAVALDSLLTSRRRDWEVVVVDDGSGDESLARAGDWIARHETAAALLLQHPVNRGLASARNAALAFARGEFCFVLDADNEILPNCFDLLVGALEDDPGAVFAYGMLERFTPAGPAGLMNVFPWDPARFRDGNYIDAMALVRTRAMRELGGYRTDRRLHGWEDYDLWARMAERGLRAHHVPRVVARYRTSGHSMLSVTNISGAEARSMVAAAAPTVMGEPPVGTG